ncbi:MAG: hypothetical protein AB8G96_03580 [Phycisphaerales bacterium]
MSGPSYGGPANGSGTIDERSAERREELSRKYGGGDVNRANAELPPRPAGDPRLLDAAGHAAVLVNDLMLANGRGNALTDSTGRAVSDPATTAQKQAPGLDSRADRARRAADADRRAQSQTATRPAASNGRPNDGIMFNGGATTPSTRTGQAGGASTTADYITGAADLPPARRARPSGAAASANPRPAASGTAAHAAAGTDNWRSSPFGRPEARVAVPTGPRATLGDASDAAVNAQDAAGVRRAPNIDATAAASAGYRRALLDRVIDGANGPLDDLIAMALSFAADPDGRIEPEYYRGLTPEQREVVDAFEEFAREVSKAATGEGDPEELVRITEQLRDRLARTPMLAIRNPSMCLAVEGFGNVEPVANTAFPAGVETPVLIYAEVDEFTSRTDDSGDWITSLELRTSIYSDRETMPVWSGDWHQVLDKSRTQRRDFFVTQELWIPDALSLGRYHVKLELRDRASGAVDEQSLPFDVVVRPR